MDHTYRRIRRRQKGRIYIWTFFYHQKIEEAKEEEGREDIEDLDLVSNKLYNQVDLIVTMNLEEPYGSSEDKSMAPMVPKEDLTVDAPHIGFILGDESWVVKDFDMTVQIQRLKHPMV